jgi:uncharacterized protein YdcH (DUF465 family)
MIEHLKNKERMIERIMDEKNSLNEGLIKAENIMRRSGSSMQSK